MKRSRHATHRCTLRRWHNYAHTKKELQFTEYTMDMFCFIFLFSLFNSLLSGTELTSSLEARSKHMVHRVITSLHSYTLEWSTLQITETDNLSCLLITVWTCSYPTILTGICRPKSKYSLLP